MNTQSEAVEDIRRILIGNKTPLNESIIESLKLTIDSEGISISFTGTKTYILYEFSLNGNYFISSQGQAYPSLAQAVMDFVKPILPNWSSEKKFVNVDTQQKNQAQDKLIDYLKSIFNSP